MNQYKICIQDYENLQNLLKDIPVERYSPNPNPKKYKNLIALTEFRVKNGFEICYN